MTSPPLKEIEESIYDVLNRIRRKPGLYIGDAKLTRLDSFIAGYLAGLAKGGLTFRREAPDFHRYHDWIARRLGYTESTSGWYMMICGRCSGEHEAFDRFYGLLDEFRASGSKTPANLALQ